MFNSILILLVGMVTVIGLLLHGDLMNAIWALVATVILTWPWLFLLAALFWKESEELQRRGPRGGDQR